MKPRPGSEISPASASSTIRTGMERLVLVQLPLLTQHIHVHLSILRRARDLVALQTLHANFVVAPDQVREAVPRNVGLRAGGVGDPVHVAAEDAAGPLDERVAEVDDGAVGLRPDVLPRSLVGGFAAGRQDLEPADGAAEEGDGADVGVLEQRGAAVGRGLGRVADRAQQRARRTLPTYQRRQGPALESQTGVENGQDLSDDAVSAGQERRDDRAVGFEDVGMRARRRVADEVVLDNRVEFAAVRRAIVYLRSANGLVSVHLLAIHFRAVCFVVSDYQG